jgi:hypothetical protein
MDRAVSAEVLGALQPFGVEAALSAWDRRQESEDQKQRALELALDKCRYEANRAQRQYDAADPRNRLVAAELERRWNEALQKVAGLETRLEMIQQSGSGRPMTSLAVQPKMCSAAGFHERTLPWGFSAMIARGQASARQDQELDRSSRSRAPVSVARFVSDMRHAQRL